MALKVTVGGKDVSATVSTLSTTEDVTPLRLGDDSPAGVGSFATNITARFADAMYQRDRLFYAKFDRFGGARGRVTTASGGTGATVSFSGESVLGELVVDVKAKPFKGTLRKAVLYYMSLVGISTPVVVEAAIAEKAVVLPGFVGELWDFLAKQIAPVIGFEIAAVDNTIQVRRPRLRKGSVAREMSGPSWSQDMGFKATRIIVAYYGRTWHADALMYPGPTLSADDEIISIDAGQTIDVTLEVPYSVSSLQQPSYVDRMTPGGTTGAYTAVGSDNLPITPGFWNANGGRLRVKPGDEPNQIIATITAPAIEFYSPYRLAMNDGETDYAALRVRGAGVLVDRKEIVVETGLGNETDAEASFDSIMVGTRTEAYEIAVAALSRHLGNKQRIDGNVSTLAAPAGGSPDGLSGQVAGNVAGARVQVYDGLYRITNATLSPSNVGFSAIMDTTVNDTRDIRADKKIATSNTRKAGARIRDVNATPLREDWR